MKYFTVENKCSVDFFRFNLPISHAQALDILLQKGFIPLQHNIIEFARSCIGLSEYQRGVHVEKAPILVDCSSFVKWLYAQLGIWLPRRSIQQRKLGNRVLLDEIRAGDLVFTTGKIDYYDEDPQDGVGHVGVATNNGTIIHAANSQKGVVETPIHDFCTQETFRGVRRIVNSFDQLQTFQIPEGIQVEFDDDIRWIILQSLPNPQ
jgi:hypothetical protein